MAKRIVPHPPDCIDSIESEEAQRYGRLAKLALSSSDNPYPTVWFEKDEHEQFVLWEIVPDIDDPTGLLTWAAEKLKGNERTLVELLTGKPDGATLVDLALKLDWPVPCDNPFNSLRSRVNRKLKRAKKPFKVERHNNVARLVSPPAPDSTKKY